MSKVKKNKVREKVGAVGIKHIEVLKNAGKYGVVEAAKKAGYSDSYAESGGLSKTESWNKLLNKYLRDEALLAVHKKGLKAKSTIYATKDGKITDVREVPDYHSRRGFLDLGYKVKKRYEEQHRLIHEFGELDEATLRRRHIESATRVAAGFRNLLKNERGNKVEKGKRKS